MGPDGERVEDFGLFPIGQQDRAMSVISDYEVTSDLDLEGPSGCPACIGCPSK